MEVEIAKLLIAQGGFALIALLIFAAYRKDVLSKLGTEKGTAEILIQVVKEVTVAVTRLTAVVEALDQQQQHPRGKA